MRELIILYMKYFLVFFFSCIPFFFPSCTRYFIETPVARPGTISEHIDVKTALIGFYAYRSRVVDKTWERLKPSMNYKASIFRDPEFQKLLPYARPVAAIPAKGYDRKIHPARINYLIHEYLQFTGKGGIGELKHVIAYQGRIPRWKKREVDYYILGVFAPELQKTNRTITGWFSCLGSVLTLGILPIYDEHPAGARFYVFNRELFLQKIFTYSTAYYSLSTWWMPPTNLPENIGRSPPPDNWIPAVLKFRVDYVKWLKKNPRKL